MKDLKEIYVFHDNCTRNCIHCFCKLSGSVSPSDLEQTEKIMHSFQKRGYSVQAYVSDPRQRDAFERLIRPFGYKMLELKDTITPSYYKEILKDSVTIGLSLHGHCPEIHELICEKGNFQKTIKTLEVVKKEKLKNVRVYCVVFKKNYLFAEEICKLINSYGVSKIRFLRLMHLGRAKDLPDDMFLDKEAYIHFFEIFQEVKRKFRHKIDIDLESPGWGPYYTKVTIKVLKLMGRIIKKQFYHCQCGQIKIVIDPRTKRFFPCYGLISYNDISLGYYDESQGLIMDNPLWLQNLIEKIEEPCRSCKLLWMCGGHCRIQAIEEYYSVAKNTNIYSGHKWCPVVLGIRRPFDSEEACNILRMIPKKLFLIISDIIYDTGGKREYITSCKF